MKKTRKESNCKSKRLERVILELYNVTSLTSAEIGRALNLSSETIKKVGKRNAINIERIKMRGPSIWRKEERNVEIIEALKNGDKYDKIASNFNITKQRVQAIAIKNGISRWEQKRTKFKSIIKQINKDYKLGLTFEELIEKYNMNDPSFKHQLKYYGLESLEKRFRNVRNNEIITTYKNTTANVVLMNPNPVLNDPNRIETISSVYKISSKSGFSKYPNIRRGVKGLFADPQVIKIIKARKTSPYKYTNKMIADELNESGFKTTYGKKFSWHTIQNIWDKYQRQGARKTKVKYN